MLTKTDLTLIENLIDKKLEIRFQAFLKEITEMFMATNERIDKVIDRLESVEKNLNGRIDKVIIKLDEHHDIMESHERRIEKLEEKVIPN